MNRLTNDRQINFIPITNGDNFTEINYGWTLSPFGQCLIYFYNDYIVGLAFNGSNTRKAAEIDMTSRWKKSRFFRDNQKTSRWGKKIFYQNEDLNLMVWGTTFQTDVWSALLNISFGRTVTYSEISHLIKAPNSVRAVATAIGKNPIAWLIPCHRVISKSSALSGYHWGLELKQKMLHYEGSLMAS